MLIGKLHIKWVLLAKIDDVLLKSFTGYESPPSLVEDTCLPIINGLVKLAYSLLTGCFSFMALAQKDMSPLQRAYFPQNFFKIERTLRKEFVRDSYQ